MDKKMYEMFQNHELNPVISPFCAPLILDNLKFSVDSGLITQRVRNNKSRVIRSTYNRKIQEINNSASNDYTVNSQASYMRNILRDS